MMQKVFQNAVQFPHQQLKCIAGSIPTDIKGRYFRNGPFTYYYDKDNVLSHWFNGTGSILKVELNKGQCYSQMSEVDTPLSQDRNQKRKFNESFFADISRARKDPHGMNQANTSVHPMQDAEVVLALCEGGSPYLIRKRNLEMLGFNNYSWIQMGFSAHPKIDPENGDIWNIGTNFRTKTVTISQSSLHMRLKQSTDFKLRKLQSIHDFCLAGDYVVIFECPVYLDFFTMLRKTRLSSMGLDQSLPTLIHIYSKKDLSFVKTLEVDPFMVFHFSNGFSNEKQIVLQYCRYSSEGADSLFKYINNVPKYSQGYNRYFPMKSSLEEMTINLQNFSTKVKSEQLSCEFPVVENQVVGKEWETTYIPISSKKNFVMDTLASYNRVTGKWIMNNLGEDVYINQPVIIPGESQNYLMSIISRDGNSFAEIFDSKTIERICQIEMPEYVPPSFHGKWDNQL